MKYTEPVKSLHFECEGLSASNPTPNTEDPYLVGCPRLLVQHIALSNNVEGLLLNESAEVLLRKV
jgi:hypothetical protein